MSCIPIEICRNTDYSRNLAPLHGWVVLSSWLVTPVPPSIMALDDIVLHNDDPEDEEEVRVCEPSSKLSSCGQSVELEGENG